MDEKLTTFLEDDNGGKGLVGELSLWNEGIEGQILKPRDETEVFRYIGTDEKGKQELEDISDEIKVKMEEVIEKDVIYFNSEIPKKIFTKNKGEVEIRDEFIRMSKNYPIKVSELNKYNFFNETTFDIDNGLKIEIITQILNYVNDFKKNNYEYHAIHFNSLTEILLKKYLSLFNKEVLIVKDKLYYSLSETYSLDISKNKKSNKIFKWNGIPTGVKEHYYYAEKKFLSRVSAGDILINSENLFYALVNIFKIKYLPQITVDVKDKGKYSNNDVKITKYISFNEYFDLLSSGKEEFYIDEISREKIWDGHELVNNRDYVNNDTIINNIPEKKEIISKIQELDIIKDIGGFEKFVQQEEILLKDIMKDNILINKLSDLLISGEYFKVKK